MATLYRENNGSWTIRFKNEFGDRKTVFLGRGFTKKTANGLKDHIETLIDCRKNNQQPDQRVFAYLETAPVEIRTKLESVGLIRQSKIMTLGQLWESYIADKRYEGNTKATWNTSRQRFFSFFKESDAIESLTRTSIVQFQKHLEKQYKPATVATSFAKVRAICNWAVANELFVKSPATGIKGGDYHNKENDRFVEMEDYEKMLAACRTQEQRTILTLARIGGLRIPSEIANLTWADIHWDDNDGKVWINSPKTAHHEGKAGRFVPLWEPMRKELTAMYFADEPDGKTDRIFRNRKASSNLRTRFMKIQIRAGLVPIPRFFDNCRASRSNEVLRKYGPFLESQWIGHTQAIAMRYYYQVRDTDFNEAVRERFDPKTSEQLPVVSQGMDFSMIQDLSENEAEKLLAHLLARRIGNERNGSLPQETEKTVKP